MDAENFLSKSKRAHYDSPEIVEVNLELFRHVHLFDWPVLYALQRLAAEGKLKSVVDFGGHVGAKYYAYRSVMDFPWDLKWQVVDVPAVCAEGSRRLKPEDSNLSYSEDIGKIDACDVLFCSGSLQYSDEHLFRLLAEIPLRPQVIILNKVAVSDDMFYTLESFEIGRMPYKIVTQDYLDDVRRQFDYRKSIQWSIPEMNFTVPHKGGKSAVRMMGEIWVDPNNQTNLPILGSNAG